MNSGTEKLIQSVTRGDFAASTSLLLELCREGISEPVITVLLGHEERSRPSLRLRDHVFNFLDLAPFYCAVQVGSLDLLRRFSGADDLAEIQTKAFTWSKGRLESDDPLILIKYLESERVLATRHAYALPNILEKKALEIESCRIPVSPNRDRFCVISLNDTFYGHRLLVGLSEKFIPPARPTPSFYRQLLVTRQEWAQISKSLADLDYEPDAMLLELVEREWSDTIQNMIQGSHHSHQSREITSTRELYDCTLALNLGYDEEAVHRIATFESNYANKELMNHVRSPKGEIRYPVVKALTDSGDAAILDFLSGLMHEADERSKGVIARGISSMTSAMSRFQKHPPKPQTRAPNPAETTSVLLSLEKLTRHPNISLRIDALRSLAEFNDPRAYNILCNAFQFDESKMIRSEIISSSKRLPREVAARILKMALQDPRRDITVQAEMTILMLGGDFLHEGLNEEEHELE